MRICFEWNNPLRAIWVTFTVYINGHGETSSIMKDKNLIYCQKFLKAWSVLLCFISLPPLWSGRWRYHSWELAGRQPEEELPPPSAAACLLHCTESCGSGPLLDSQQETISSVPGIERRSLLRGKLRSDKMSSWAKSSAAVRRPAANPNGR